MPLDDQHTYLDLHVHSTDGSDDAGGTVEGYLKWIAAKRKQGFRIDGFVLTEHRNYATDRDYSDLAARYDAVVLRGVEVETDVGHVLVFGATPEFFERFDVGAISLPYREVFRAAWEVGGIAVGAHAGRPHIGIVDHVEERNVSLEDVQVIEGLNGGSSDFENARGHDLALSAHLREIGASDSHFVTGLGRCMTRFEGAVRSIDDLVARLRDPHAVYTPVRLEETVEGAHIGERPTVAQLVPFSSRQGDLGGDEIEFDHTVIGREVHAGRVEITREGIAAYCEALEETNPLYTDDVAAASGPYKGLVAPPGILQTARMSPPPDPGINFGTSFMAGSRQEYFLPIRPGDAIDGYASVKEVYEKTGRSGRMIFVVRRTRYVNQHGENVAALETSMVHRQTRAVEGDA